MTLERAEYIYDRVTKLIQTPCPVARIYYPLSLTGASSRKELVNAIFIQVAQIHRVLSRQPSRIDELKSLEVAACSAVMSILFLRPILPDWELEAISKMDPQSIELIREKLRLHKIAENDGMMQMESMDSFLTYLQTIDKTEDNFLPKVYRRLGLLYYDFDSQSKTPGLES